MLSGNNVAPLSVATPIILDRRIDGWAPVSGATVDFANVTLKSPSGATTGVRMRAPAGDTFTAIEKTVSPILMSDYTLVGLEFFFPYEIYSGVEVGIEFRTDPTPTARTRFTFASSEIQTGWNFKVVRVDGTNAPGGNSWDDFGTGFDPATDVVNQLRVVMSNASDGLREIQLSRVIAYKGTMATPCILIGFDGFGDQTIIDRAAPIMQKYGWRAHVCGQATSSTLIDLNYLHDLGWDVIQQGERLDYSQPENQDKLGDDFDRSRQELIRLGITRGLDYFTYPWSAHNIHNVEVLREKGVKWSRSAGAYDIPVIETGPINVSPVGNLSTNALNQAAFEDVVDSTIDYGHTLCLLTHRIVDSGPVGSDITQADFDAKMAYIATREGNSDLRVLTVTEWLNAINKAVSL